LKGNPGLVPEGVAEQGNKAILKYLREQEKESEEQWLSKLMLVGQGRVGKTSLLKALLNKKFKKNEDSTHGILVGTLPIQHPSRPDVTMRLNTWDFGGQDIYHATHQFFFMTESSLYLLVWSAGMGVEESKLDYWLNNIKANAPESHIILVATHVEKRAADCDYYGLQKKYPQIKAYYEVSNRNKKGIPALRSKIAELASTLPLMGKIRPTSWLKAANAVRECEENAITDTQLNEMYISQGVPKDSTRELAKYMHELGNILYYQDDDQLKHRVILNPNWVTENIYKVLDSEDVTKKQGVLTRQHAEKLWQQHDPTIHNVFLRLLDKFDLSFNSDDNNIMYIVERLQFAPPEEYRKRWDAFEGRNEIVMKFYLKADMPPGIPTWFIARTHRFTTGNHWRHGALFADDKHLGLIQAHPNERLLVLSVRGPYPQYFFSILQEGLKVTLDRFPGIKPTQTIPCPEKDTKGERCKHEFDYDDILKRLEKLPNRNEIECPKCLRLINVYKLIYGVDPKVLTEEEIKKKEIPLPQTKDEIDAYSALTQQTYLKKRDDSDPDKQCPRLFALDADKERSIVHLHLFCEAPGMSHPTGENGIYQRVLPERLHLEDIIYYYREMLRFLKCFSTLDRFLKEYGEGIDKRFFGMLLEDELEKFLLRKIGTGDISQVEGKDLHTLYELLDSLDPEHEWGGLKLVKTPEHNYLWLCDEHARPYLR